MTVQTVNLLCEGKIINKTPQLTGTSFNGTFHYIDWELTVILLLAHIVLAMKASAASSGGHPLACESTPTAGFPHDCGHSQQCVGDGINMEGAIGAKVVDLERIYMHSTGLMQQDDLDAKVTLLAAETLRGIDGLVLNADGRRLCNELSRQNPYLKKSIGS